MQIPDKNQPPGQSNDLLYVPSTNVESWWRTQSATMALLKHAHNKAEEAARIIAEQEKRIRELEDLAATDPLTRLMNRRGFEKFFDLELARIRRRNSPGSLLVLGDLDRFKEINDTYGHQAGDACLKSAAAQLLKSIRIVDGAARFGGDEFAVLLTHTDPEKITVPLEKIRQTLSNLQIEWEGRSLSFGASVGGAFIGAETTFCAAYSAADSSLYGNKQSRRRTGANAP